jgi:segregation and condensation protein A
MAAWLAFLKSRLLLPVDETAEGPTGAELAERLAFQLERLEAMRNAAAQLMGRDRLGPRHVRPAACPNRWPASAMSAIRRI